MDVSIRDQTFLAVFYGVFLGTDVRSGPSLDSGWKPGTVAPASVLDRLAGSQQTIFGVTTWSPAPQGEHWGVYRLDWRSSHGVSSVALIHRPSVLGPWDFDESTATPRNAGLVELTGRTFAAPALSAQEEDDRRSLAEFYGEALLAQPGWHALALIKRKHT